MLTQHEHGARARMSCIIGCQSGHTTQGDSPRAHLAGARRLRSTGRSWWQSSGRGAPAPQAAERSGASPAAPGPPLLHRRPCQAGAPSRRGCVAQLRSCPALGGAQGLATLPCSAPHRPCAVACGYHSMDATSSRKPPTSDASDMSHPARRPGAAQPGTKALAGMKAGMARFIAAGARPAPAACGARAPRPPDYGLGSLADPGSGSESGSGSREVPAPAAPGGRCSKGSAGGRAFQCPHSPRQAAVDAPGDRGAPAPGTPSKRRPREGGAAPGGASADGAPGQAAAAGARPGEPGASTLGSPAKRVRPPASTAAAAAGAGARSGGGGSACLGSPRPGRGRGRRRNAPAIGPGGRQLTQQQLPFGSPGGAARSQGCTPPVRDRSGTAPGMCRPLSLGRQGCEGC